jgi:hypothetical protein
MELLGKNLKVKSNNPFLSYSIIIVLSGEED